MTVLKLDSGRYAKDCPECGEQQTYLRKNYAEASLRENKRCKKCANRDPNSNASHGMYRGIRISWLRRYETSAKLRGLDWLIDIDDVADVFENQNGRCALTGWDLAFPETGHSQNADASIDRIDSTFGYIKDNIQIVHKKVNMMKQAYSQEEFIEVCVAVANREKW